MKKLLNNLELPSEILKEILLRVPLDSIADCRLVCKSWNTLIVHSYFAQHHHSLSPLSLIIVARTQQGTRFGVLPLNLTPQPQPPPFKFKRPTIQHNDVDFTLVGSCNGLVCVTGFNFDLDEDDVSAIVLCNPLFGKRFVIDDIPKTENCSVNQYMFGYVPSTRQYKIVKAAVRKKRLMFYVCTIDSGWAPSPWRRTYGVGGKGGIKQLLPSVFYNSAFVNGTIVWIAGRYNKDRESKFIVYFDIETEEMGTLLLPSTIFQDLHSYEMQNPSEAMFGVGVCYDDDRRGFLYLCDEGPSLVNIWVMEDCKCIESLKLKWVIEMPHEERVPVKLLKVLKDGKLLISVANSKLAYYDPSTGVVQKLDRPEFPQGSELIVDVPSFLGCLIKYEN